MAFRPKGVVVPLLFFLFFLLYEPLGFDACVFALGPTKPKNILLLFHGSPGQPVYDMTLSGIRTAIQSSYEGPLNLYAEYLDAERFPEKAHLQAQSEFIRKKYTSDKMDLLIPIGPEILPLISRYLSPDFNEIPTVFIELRVVYPHVTPMDRRPNMTGLISEPDYRKTLEAALSLHPGTNQAFVITGASPTDRLLESVARVVYREFEDRITLTYLSGLAMEDLLKTINRLPKKSIVLYMSLLQDAKGINYYGQESCRLLAEASSAPIYGGWEHLLGQGITGGYVQGVRENASKVGQFCLRILQGVRPETIPVERGSMAYMFDWRQMKRWGIEDRNLPAGSIVINKEQTFFEAFKWYIVGIILFVMIETLLVVFLIELYRKQRRVKMQLRAAAEEWRTTFDSIRDLIFILDRDLKILRVNAPVLAFLNLPVEKVLGRPCYALMHGTDEPPETCLIRKMIQAKGPEDTEYYDHGRKAWFHISVAPILDAGGKIISIVHQVRDITEQKRTEGENHRARSELLRLERSFRINALTASLAHELNQPLAAILSNAQAALHFLEPGKPDLHEIREILRDIIQDNKRAGNVIRSLRSMIRREEEKKTPVQLNDVLQDVVSIFHGEAVFRNVEMVTEFGEPLPQVMADGVQLQQVALNLIMNAAEAMSRNSLEDRRVILRTEATDTHVKVSVRDFGEGIAPENRNRLFQPFFTTKGNGLGMGLAISKSIIEAHGGHTWAESNPEGGTTFLFELPTLKQE